MIILQNGLVFAGVILLVAALFPVRRLILQLPPGHLRRSWYVLTALILCFIAGYVGYSVTRINSYGGPLDLVVPVIFFLGAYFVFQVNSLSFRTALDGKRLAILEQENIMDPIMGIYNRRHLERRLKEEVMRAQRFNLPLTLLLLDIDNFKQINDSYGHQTGDRVLGCVGECIQKTVRITDIVARYGGDEILVIAPNTDVPSAGELAERLRHAVGDSLAPAEVYTRGLKIRCEVSIGVAGLGQGITDSLALLSDVDEAMYRAKREGRNRVVIGAKGVPHHEESPIPGGLTLPE
jgi:diguanylate cyclase (GGDEF)-like protein